MNLNVNRPARVEPGDIRPSPGAPDCSCGRVATRLVYPHVDIDNGVVAVCDDDAHNPFRREEIVEEVRLPRVFKVLDLSTAHLTKSVCQNLSSYDGVVAYNHGHYGWLMWVPEDPDQYVGLDDAPPDEVLTVQRYARARDCDYVLFDRDAGITDELPTWDW